MLELLGELWSMLRQRRHLWLGPLVVLLVLFGLLLVLAETSVLAPLIYTLF